MHEDQKHFSLRARRKSFSYAFRGLRVMFRSQHNAWIQVVMAMGVAILGILLQISGTEWALIMLAITGVLAAEAFNTALEIDIDLTSPDEHPYARDTKDVAAGAVLLAAIGAVGVGVAIFLPKLLAL